MRPLTEEETKILFLKLSEYIGRSIERLINRTDERFCFRLVKERVYYVSESVMKESLSVSRENLLSLGTCFGKFSKTGKFRLHITSLDYLSQYAKVCTFPMLRDNYVKSNLENCVMLLLMMNSPCLNVTILLSCAGDIEG